MSNYEQASEEKLPQEAVKETSLRGKSAIVSGGTSGIGRAIVEMLLGEGARVLVFDVNQEKLDESLGEMQSLGEVSGVQADQSKIEDVQRVFREAEAKLGGVDILVNNAAVYEQSVVESDPAVIANTIAVNILGPMWCTHEAVTRMKENGGDIINIGSISAHQREAGVEVYVATKAAIQAFSESLRKTAHQQNVRIALIEPGLVSSDLVPMEGSEHPHLIAEGQMLRPQHIADAARFILTRPPLCNVVALQMHATNLGA